MEYITTFEKNKAILAELIVKSEGLIPELKSEFSEQEIDRIIQMAWEDRTPFEAIEYQFGISEKQVIELMRLHSKYSSFKMWRKRMTARKTKHQLLRSAEVDRFKCTMQRSTGNKIAKR
jgi:uncharacterized protein (TIGR03643 family)